MIDNDKHEVLKRQTIFKGEEITVKRYWKHLESQRVWKTRILTLRQDKYHFLPNDIIRDFTVLEFNDWVNIIPVTADGDVVMIRQYRIGMQKETIEIPGGVVSRHDMSPKHAAVREMQEETGYFSEDVIHIGTVHPNPAIQNNKCYTYLARDAYPKSAQMLDPTEAIKIELLKKEAIFKMIKNAEITHGLVISAFAYLMLYENSNQLSAISIQ